MISLVAAAAVAAFGTGRLLGWMRRRRAAVESAPALDTKPDASARLVGFPCGLGDVVLLAHGEEAWLAGALLLREHAAEADEAGDDERTVAVLFIAPDRGEDRAVYARGAPAPSLDWLTPVRGGALVVGAEPPFALEHEGERFERTRRLPLNLTRAGTGAPDLGTEGLVGEYEGGAGARLLVVIGRETTAIWRGRRLEEGMYDVLPAAEPG